MTGKSYSELIDLPTFRERYLYLQLRGHIGDSTFGFNRYVNQGLYTSKEWKSLRNKIIIRDNGCDLAHPDYKIVSRPTIHHINPISLEMLEDLDPSIFDPENLISVSLNTHNAIHYGDETLLPSLPVERMPYDTCPWKNLRRNNYG
jgi:hypothetical protein